MKHQTNSLKGALYALCLALLLLLAPALLAVPARADGVTHYNLWVGGQQVTSANLKYEGGQGDAYGTGKWSYDPSIYTLTLDTYSYTGEGYYFTDYDDIYDRNVSCAAALFYDGETPLTIELVGENSLTQTASLSRPLDESYGMLSYGDGEVTIQSAADPKGSLTLTAGDAKNYSQGIYIYDDLSVTDATLTATGGTAEYSYGLEAWDISVTDATLSAAGGDALVHSIGVDCFNLTVNSATLTAAGGRSIGADSSSVGITCDAVEIQPDLMVS